MSGRIVRCATPAVFAFLALLAGSTVARAQSDDDAVYTRALRDRRHHHDDRALQLLRAHYVATRQARALASIALVEHDLGDFDLAERHLSEALTLAPSAWITANRATLETVLQACRRELGVGALRVESGTVGAAVFMNGARVEDVGRAVRVTAGQTAFEVRAPGHRTASRTVDVALGSTVVERIDLERDAPAPPAETTAPVAPVALAPPPLIPTGASRPPDAAPVVARPRTRPSNTLRILAWTSAVGAGLFVGAGVVGQVVGQPAADRWNSTGCFDAPTVTPVECDEALVRAQSSGAVRWVGFVGGGALAVASVVLFVRSGGEPRNEAFACGPSAGGFGITCRGRF